MLINSAKDGIVEVTLTMYDCEVLSKGLKEALRGFQGADEIPFAGYLESLESAIRIAGESADKLTEAEFEHAIECEKKRLQNDLGYLEAFGDLSERIESQRLVKANGNGKVGRI